MIACFEGSRQTAFCAMTQSSAVQENKVAVVPERFLACNLFRDLDVIPDATVAVIVFCKVLNPLPTQGQGTKQILMQILPQILRHKPGAAKQGFNFLSASVLAIHVGSAQGGHVAHGRAHVTVTRLPEAQCLGQLIAKGAWLRRTTGVLHWSAASVVHAFMLCTTLLARRSFLAIRHCQLSEDCLFERMRCRVLARFTAFRDVILASLCVPRTIRQQKRPGRSRARPASDGLSRKGRGRGG
eukprot:6184061-Pleurochrysis_carterae.AAC.3